MNEENGVVLGAISALKAYPRVQNEGRKNFVETTKLTVYLYFLSCGDECDDDVINIGN